MKMVKTARKRITPGLVVGWLAIGILPATMMYLRVDGFVWVIGLLFGLLVGGLGLAAIVAFDHPTPFPRLAPLGDPVAYGRAFLQQYPEPRNYIRLQRLLLKQYVAWETVYFVMAHLEPTGRYWDTRPPAPPVQWVFFFWF